MAVVEPGSEVAEPLNERQLDALRRLEELGASPRPDPAAPYSKDPQVRAYQMIYEGRLGGPGRGQGRKRKPRASELLAERIRKKVDKMETAIDNALDSENEKVALAAVQTSLKIEHDEAALKLQEEKLDADLNKQSKEELVATLIALAGDPSIVASVEGIIDLPDSQVTEITEAEVITDDRGAATTRTVEAATTVDEARSNGRGDRRNGRGTATADRAATPNPFTEAAKRRAAKRR